MTTMANPKGQLVQVPLELHEVSGWQFWVAAVLSTNPAMQLRQTLGSVEEQVAQGRMHCFMQVRLGLRVQPVTQVVQARAVQERQLDWGQAVQTWLEE